MAKRLPSLNSAELIGFEQKLNAVKGLSRSQRKAVMASMKTAANPLAESPEFGYASLPDERRKIATQSISATSGIFGGIENNVIIDYDDQREINEALNEANETGKDRIDWRLVVGLLAYFLFSQSKEKSLYDAIEAAYVSAWQLAIKEQAARYGCPNARIGKPSGSSLREIQKLAKRDSDSIAKTYNEDAQRSLRKLYDANPLGNIAYYLSGMQEWARTRQQHKNLTISITNVQNGYGLGLQDFMMNNRVETGFRLVGAPPVCPTCIYLMSLGEVDMQTVMSYGFGLIHPGCPHYWQSTNTYKIPCSSMWSG